jgi:hypothetical protein
MHHLPRIALVLLVSMLAACGGGHHDDALSVAFPPAPLPMYSVGDSYSFDDGSVDTVTGATDDEVRWRTATGARFVTSHDVLLPPLQWDDAARRGRRSYAASSPLFPLQPGSSMTATATIVQQPDGGGPEMSGQENWQCRVGDAQRIRVAVGLFDTVRVDCAVKEIPSGRYAQRSFFYAPSIGFYVRRIDRIGDAPPRTTQLVGWTDGNPPLPDSALRQRVSAIQRAMENQPSGAVVNWQDATAQVSGSVEPVQTVRADDGRWCRNFQEHVAAFGRRYALTGEACRESAGGWQVVSMAPFKAG